MRKIVKKTGTSLCIYLNREDCIIYNLEEGDIVSFDNFINHTDTTREHSKTQWQKRKPTKKD